jgi:chloramphenicol 3-O-phosphotransferase
VLSAPGDHSAGDWQVAVRAQAEAEQARRELHRTGKAPGQGHGRYAAAQAEAEGQQEPAVQAQAVLPDTSPTAVPDDDAAVFGESPILSSLV